MTDSGDEDPPEEGETDRASEAYLRRELTGVVIMLWLAGSISDLSMLRLVYGLQGYGWFGYGGHSPPEY